MTDMADKGKILVVDDTPASLKLLADLLKAEGYEVRAAISGELALHAASSSPPELVMLDIRMPGMDGYEVCRRLKAQPETREVPVIFVSAASETEEKLKGFEIGAVDYVTKPYQRDELLARVRTHLELNRLRHHLEDIVKARTAELQASQKQLKASLLESISALAATVELRDPYTAGHQRRVAQLAVAIATEMQLPEAQVEGIYLAGVVHDVGKIQIPAEILSKPGKLSDLEFALIKQHPQAGHELLKTIDFPWQIATIVQQHHERQDGSGYPDALQGEQVLLESRIIGVADVVEAMFSHRPYRPGLGIEAALEEIARGRGTRYDAQVVDACVALFREKDYVIPN
ncbi:HD-GYP domain-containing protein [Sideroxyarcus sp. TK5]